MVLMAIFYWSKSYQELVAWSSMKTLFVFTLHCYDTMDESCLPVQVMMDIRVIKV